jgi:multiple sugar transport system substrate-binding protein
MQNISVFQLVVFGICGALVLAGVIVFAAFNRYGDSGVGTVVMWGTIPQTQMDTLIQSLRESDASFQNVTYLERPAANFDAALLNAIASGNAPDLVFLSQEHVTPFMDKLLLIPYDSVSESEFQSSFIGEAELFLLPQGILAMPFMLDPLLMYWNTDMFAAAGIASPPKYWSELLAHTPELTKLSPSRDIEKSAVALGTWSNVTNAKAILSALTMQAGDSIVAVNASGKPAVVFGMQPAQNIESPAASALRFYTDFADPSKTSYSWNRTRPSSQESFAAGDLAVYIGFASEYPAIAARNPNLRFAVEPLPQVGGAPTPVTFGRLTGIAIPRGTRNYQGAARVAELLSGATATGRIAEQFDLPPVRRDLIKPIPDDAAKTAFMQSALIARGWLDPNPTATNDIFGSMVEWVLSGKYVPSESVAAGSLSLQRLLPQ